MPIFEMPSPLTAASDAVGAYTGQKKANEETQFQRERALKSEQYQQQELALRSRQTDIQQQQVESEQKSRELHDSIDKANNDYMVSQRPVAEKLAQLSIKEKEQTIHSAELDTLIKEGQVADDKYIRHLTGMGLSAAQAMAQLQLVHAQIQNYAVTQAHDQQRINIESQQAKNTAAYQQGSLGIQRGELGVAQGQLGIAGQNAALARSKQNWEQSMNNPANQLTNQEAQTEKFNRQHGLTVSGGLRTGTRGAGGTTAVQLSSQTRLAVAALNTQNFPEPQEMTNPDAKGQTSSFDEVLYAFEHETPQGRQMMYKDPLLTDNMKNYLKRIAPMIP